MSRPDLFPALACLALLLLAATPVVRAEVKVGDRFPELADAGLAGTVPSSTGRIVLVDFWASWCAPCKASFPSYARLHADYGSRGLVIAAVSVDEDEAAFAAFVKKFSPPFAVLRDKDQQLVRQVDVPAMPTCFLLDWTGRVRLVHRGFHGEESEQALRREIEQLLAEKSSTP